MLVSDEISPDFSDPTPDKTDRLTGAKAAAERARADVRYIIYR